jgi:hypothetical protein
VPRVTLHFGKIGLLLQSPSDAHPTHLPPLQTGWRTLHWLFDVHVCMQRWSTPSHVNPVGHRGFAGSHSTHRFVT